MYLCTLCDKKAATMLIMEGHLEGKGHKKRLDDRQWYEATRSTSTDGTSAVLSSTVLPACVEWQERGSCPRAHRRDSQTAGDVRVSHLHRDLLFPGSAKIARGPGFVPSASQARNRAAVGHQDRYLKEFPVDILGCECENECWCVRKCFYCKAMWEKLSV
jgi:hypothetical protein